MKTILVDAVNTFVIKDEWIHQNMYDLLEWYENKKIILTNATEEQMDTFGLTDLPYDLFTLEHNPDKPDPKYYYTMLDHFGLKARDVVYFEHNEDAVRSAISVWIDTFHYNKEEKDLKWLKEFLDWNLK